MPQISLYIDEETLRMVEREAEREQLSISKWVIRRIKDKTAPAYPPRFKDLFGAAAELDLDRPDQQAFGQDSPREAL